MAGNVLLGLSLAAVLVACICYFLAARGESRALLYARWAVVAFTACVALACLYLLVLLLSDSFEVAYVWQHSARAQPLVYKVSAFWAGHEGSLLLWLFCGAACTLALSVAYQRDRVDAFESPAMLAMSALQLFPMALLLRANPFSAVPATPADGIGLNPLLQDPYMAIHPPMLFLGFAALAGVYAVAIASLWRRDYSGWTARAKPWALAGWGLLGLGIALGAFWAYRVQGWGGYWGWDPVENASLATWLLAGALVHGLLAQKARGRMARWNLLLALATYVSILYAAFLTRSGVLAEFSVHTYSESPHTFVMLAALLLVAIAGLAPYLARYREIPSGPDTFRTLLSREFTSLTVVIVFVFFAVVISAGTASPIVTGLLGASTALCGDDGLLAEMGAVGARLCRQGAVATSYYTATSAPLAFVLAALMALAPILAWRQSNPRTVVRMIAWPVVAACLLTALAAVALRREPAALALLFLAILALGVNAAMIALIVRADVWKIGGYLAHVGVALALVGVIGTTAYKTVEPLLVFEGQSAQAAGYRFAFQGLEQVSVDTWAVALEVQRGDTTFSAEPRLMSTSDGALGYPFIRKSPLEDLYLAPLEYDPGQGLATLLELQVGQSAQAEGHTITFVDYARSDQDQTPGAPVVIGAVLQAEKDGVVVVITPTVMVDERSGLVVTPATVPGTTIEVALERPGPSVAVISVVDRASSSLTVLPSIMLEVSLLPWINALWLGVLTIAAGTGVAAVRRRREGQRARQSGAEPASG